MARPFAKIRGQMVANGMDQQYLGRKLHLSPSCVSDRLNARYPWTLTEMYSIMDMFSIPNEQMHEYFPRRGQNEAGVIRPMRSRRAKGA